jgi:hypothetical protein
MGYYRSASCFIIRIADLTRNVITSFTFLSEEQFIPHNLSL